MKTTNSNRVNMINTLIAYCEMNALITALITMFATVLAAVKAKMVLINSLNQIADGTTTGVTLDTKALRKAMTDLALKCANATLAYANSVSNNTLAALVNYSESKLNSLKKEDVDDVCETIHDATNTNIVLVGPFGVAASDVTDLQAAINLYRTASQNPRQAIISKSQAKQQVTNMIREVIDDLLVAQMDKMVNTLKSSQLNFWSGYKQSREIVDLGSSTAKVRGTVLDMNDAPVKGVTFRITKTATGDFVAETETDVKGKYGIAKLPSGDFNFEWSKDGYTTVTEDNVHISAGKDLRRKIVMKKNAVREGDVVSAAIVNIDITGIKGSAATTVSIEGGASNLRFYGSTTPNGLPGALFIDVPAGTDMVKTAEQFMALTGLSDTVGFLNVQNIGAVVSHFKITFENLE